MCLCKPHSWLVYESLLVWLLISQPTTAQIFPDNTLPVNSIVPPNCLDCDITGGTQVGNNLFHSFEQFSIPTGGAARFNNAATVENIFSRVTGNSVSDIDGLITANPSANLFLLNPNGIVFGPNALLDVGSSFLATTADSINFADGTQFSATHLQSTTPLLTISVPIGLQFGTRAETISVQSFLEIPSDKTLAIVGGNILLEGGTLSTVGGRIELGSVANGSLVNFDLNNTGLALRYEGVQEFQDIQLSQVATVFTDGVNGGAIQVQGKNLILADNSVIVSSTFEAGIGGTLAINATQSVRLSGGSLIATSTEGEGRAGDIVMRVGQSIELIEASGLGSQVCAMSSNCNVVTGRGGDIIVETSRLLLQDGSRIDASTFGKGQGGDIRVEASDIELIGAAPGPITSGIFTQVAQGAIPDSGIAGNLTIETKRLIALDGGQISTGTFSGGNGGILSINASDFIYLSGAAPSAAPDVGRSGFFAPSEPGATGNAGTVNITTRQLTVEDGAEISVRNFGGQAGNLTITAHLISLNQGRLTAVTSGGSGAEISLQKLDLLLMNNQSLISAEARNFANGGNITIDATNGFIIAVPDQDSDVIANAVQGQGGNIRINTQNILGLDERKAIRGNGTNDIDASSEFGSAGTIAINTPDVDPSQGLVALPINLADPSGLISQQCSPTGKVASSSFVMTGKGGLPPNPINSLSGETVITRLATVENERSQQSVITAEVVTAHQPTPTIVEAQGWVKDAEGQVALVTEASTATPTSLSSSSPCQQP